VRTTSITRLLLLKKEAWDFLKNAYPKDLIHLEHAVYRKLQEEAQQVSGDSSEGADDMSYHLKTLYDEMLLEVSSILANKEQGLDYFCRRISVTMYPVP